MHCVDEFLKFGRFHIRLEHLFCKGLNGFGAGPNELVLGLAEFQVHFGVQTLIGQIRHRPRDGIPLLYHGNRGKMGTKC